MKALLLAAGRGTRISRYLQGNPKCTVDIAGMPLVIYTINMLKKKGVTDIAIVTGYRHEVVEDLVAKENVKIFYNPFYDVTNSIASAWFAKEFLQDDDVMIMNADVFCEETIYDELLALKKNPVMLSDSTRKEDADYKFYYENDRLIKYGKELTGDDITGEYVGIAKLAKSFVPTFVNKLEEMIQTQQHSVWWENVLYSMIGERDILVHDIAGNFWAEVDYIEDYQRILKFCEEKHF